MSLRKELAFLIDGRKELRDWELWAKDCIHLKIVRNEADLAHDSTVFHPVYTRMYVIF